MSKPSQFTQFGARTTGERFSIGEHCVINRIGTVQFQQTQSSETQVHTIDRPVMQTGDTERTAIAHSLGEHLPRIPSVLLVVPCHLGHVSEMIRLLQSDPVGSWTDPQIRMESLHHENPYAPGSV